MVFSGTLKQSLHSSCYIESVELQKDQNNQEPQKKHHKSCRYGSKKAFRLTGRKTSPRVWVSRCSRQTFSACACSPYRPCRCHHFMLSLLFSPTIFYSLRSMLFYESLREGRKEGTEKGIELKFYERLIFNILGTVFPSRTVAVCVCVCVCVRACVCVFIFLPFPDLFSCFLLLRLWYQICIRIYNQLLNFHLYGMHNINLTNLSSSYCS